MRIYKTNKQVLCIRDNPARFLNGITSNTMDSHHNAFLNIHGKIVATFDQVKVTDDEYYILLEEPFVDRVLEHVGRFLALSGSKIEDLDLNVYYDLDGDAVHNDTEDVIIPQEFGRLVITEKEFEPLTTDQEFTLFRLDHDIPIQGIDYDEDFLLNVSTDKFVSFTKGCFLGQEPISKVYNRSKPTWRLVVKFEDECSEEEKEKMTSKAKDPFAERTFGFVFEQNED